MFEFNTAAFGVGDAARKVVDKSLRNNFESNVTKSHLEVMQCFLFATRLAAYHSLSYGSDGADASRLDAV